MPADATSRIEQHHLAHHQRFASGMQHLPASVYLSEPHDVSSVLFHGSQVDGELGYSQAEWEADAQFWLKIIHPDDRERVQQLNAEASRTGEPLSAEFRYIAKDGSIVWMRDDATLIHDEHGVPLYWQGVVIDITEQKRASEDLRRAETRYRTLIEHIDAAAYIYVEGDTQVPVYMSPQIESISGYPAERWAENYRFGFEIIHPDDRAMVEEKFRSWHDTDHPAPAEYRYIRPDGTFVWVRNSVRKFHDAQSGQHYWQGVIVDISALKRTEIALRQSEARYAAIARNFPGGAILLFDHDLRFVVADGQALDSIGMTSDAIVGRTLAEVVDEETRSRLEPVYHAALLGESSMFELHYGSVDFLVQVVPVRDEDDGIMFGMAMAMDITARRALESQLAHQALHDAVTGLPNRALLTDRADRALALSRRTGTVIAVLFLDIDNFKVVNDTLGHSEGDRLLVDLGRRLQICVRDADTVSRFGGDEFAVLLATIDRIEDAVDVAVRIQRALAVPFSVGGRDIVVSGSIGIAAGAHTVHTTDDLLRQADIAMYRAKALGKNQYALFDEAMHVSMLDRLELESDLRNAIERDQLTLCYQPQYSVSTGAMLGVEVLVRWQHPTRGLIPPDSFISLAEDTGVIVPLGAWVLRAACSQLACWLESRLVPTTFTLSVNLSGKQFSDPGLVHEVAAVLASERLPEGALTLELTESVIMADAHQTVERLRQLKQLGVSISIDDFGTGYSSLAYLKRFPVDILKIDRSFVNGLGVEQEDSAIVQATIMLARALGLYVVAEGVETECQLEHLGALGCDGAQGYFYSRPLPAAAFERLLASDVDAGAILAGAFTGKTSTRRR